MNALERPRGWALTAVRLATWLLPPGDQRERYRRELEAEMWTMTPREQWSHSLSVLRGAGALRRAVVESGAAAPAHTPLWCRLHLHHVWHREVTDDGGRYRHCLVCGIDDDGTVNQMYAGWQGANVPPSTSRH